VGDPTIARSFQPSVNHRIASVSSHALLDVRRRDGMALMITCV